MQSIEKKAHHIEAEDVRACLQIEGISRDKKRTDDSWKKLVNNKPCDGYQQSNDRSRAIGGLYPVKLFGAKIVAVDRLRCRRYADKHGVCNLVNFHQSPIDG